MVSSLQLSAKCVMLQLFRIREENMWTIKELYIVKYTFTVYLYCHNI